MKKINIYITEKLRINKDSNKITYHYYPKDRDELKSLIDKLIKERGNEADLNDIDVSNITDMSNLFAGTWNSSGQLEYFEFNGNISSWNVSNVKNMSGMFNLSNFNGDISQWDVSKVTDMNCMFMWSCFNQDISDWNISNVTNMSHMFDKSKFNGDISKWNVSKVKDMTKIFFNCPLQKNPPKWYKK